MPERGCVHEGNDQLVEDLMKLKQRVRESSHLASNYARAISSIRAHPTPLRSVREAKQLKNIGNYLANIIHSILKKRGLVEVETPAASNEPPPMARAHVEADVVAQTNISGTPSKEYVPAYRKQPWFVLLVLQKAQAVDEDRALSSDLLLQKMQEAGYDGTKGKLRTCLSSLIGTHDVVKRSNVGFYYLTIKGQRSAALCPGSLIRSCPSVGASALENRTQHSHSVGVGARKRLTAGDEVDQERTSILTCIDVQDSDDDIVSASVPEPEAEPINTSCIVPEDLIRESDTWELVLLLDHREMIERRNPRVLERKLLERNVKCEVRALGVGDVQWIARRHRIGGELVEFMMNVIVERKEVHDLSGSIVDRRFHEQKMRLATVRATCGNVHVIYLIEGSLTQMTTVRTSGLHTAMGRTQVQDNFFVQQCQSADETVTFLARVYARLLAKFPLDSQATKPTSSHLLSPKRFDRTEFARIFCVPHQTFAPFNAQFRKKTHFTVREMYERMLLQVPGLSAAKTLGLSAKYQTFRELENALRKRGRDSEVEHVRCGKFQRRLGLKSREYLCEVFTSTKYTENP